MNKYSIVLDYLHVDKNGMMNASIHHSFRLPTSSLLCLSILQSKKESYMKHKVVWFIPGICDMAFDPLQACICLFVDL